MFSLTLGKDELLKVLTMVFGAVDKKQNKPILANFLLAFSDNLLKITATDLDLEICASINTNNLGEGKTTVSARKFIDIIRTLEENADPVIEFTEKDILIKSGKSKFKLGSIAAEGFPNWETDKNIFTCDLLRQDLIKLLQSTCFAIAQQQDVRTYLNGLLLDFQDNKIIAVGADGHRIALSQIDYAQKDNAQIIMPRKSIQELLKLLINIEDEHIRLNIAKKYLEVCSKHYVFKTKLIEAQFPPYLNLFAAKYDKNILIAKDVFKRALTRMLILAHENSKVVILKVESGVVTLMSNNQNQEEATEVLVAETEGGDVEIGVNASYLLDVVNYLDAEQVQIFLLNSASSIVISAFNNKNYKYLIMPVRL